MSMEAGEHYITDTVPGKGTVIYAPSLETEEFARRLNAYGFSRHVSIGNTAFPSIGEGYVWVIESQTPYTDAMQQIGMEENAGILEGGSYHEAFEMLANDEFDSSVWASYITRQPDQ